MRSIALVAAATLLCAAIAVRAAEAVDEDLTPRPKLVSPSASRGTAPADAASPAPRAARQYATLYIFPPDMCQLREHAQIFEFIDTEATYYHDLEVVFVSMDGDPPVLRFFDNPSRQNSATIDATKLGVDDLLKLIEQHTAREKAGVQLSEDEKGYEVVIKDFTTLELREVLARHNVARSAEARPNWQPPSKDPVDAPGFKVPDHIVESGVPDVDVEDIDDTILPGANAIKAERQKKREAAAAAKAAAAAAAAAAPKTEL